MSQSLNANLNKNKKYKGSMHSVGYNDSDEMTDNTNKDYRMESMNHEQCAIVLTMLDEVIDLTLVLFDTGEYGYLKYSIC